MEDHNYVAVATQQTAAGTLAALRPAAPDTTKQPFEITVLFTSVHATVAALRCAGDLARRLNGRITLVVPQEVPYPLPLSSPPVLVEFNERRFRVIAEQARVETVVQVYLCRDRNQMIRSVLPPRSLVVLGFRHHWWPMAEKRLARGLRRAGHEV